MTAHTIRLRGPWQYRIVSRSTVSGDGAVTEEDDTGEVHNFHMPCDWAGLFNENFRGRVQFLRNFGRPSGLEPHDRVELVFDRLDVGGRVWLNDELLGELARGELPTRFAVGPILNERNRLVVEIEFPARPQTPGAGPASDPKNHSSDFAGEVRLEILSRGLS